MDKLLETLTTLYRTMLLLSAIVIAVAAYSGTDDYRYTKAQVWLTKLTEAYAKLTREVVQLVGSKYHDTILRSPVLTDQDRAIIGRMSIQPEGVILRRADNVPGRGLDLDPAEVTIGDIIALNPDEKGVLLYIYYELDAVALHEGLTRIFADPEFRLLAKAEKLNVVVRSPIQYAGEAEPMCDFSMVPEAWKGFERAIRVPCAGHEVELQEYRNSMNVPTPGDRVIQLDPTLYDLPSGIAAVRIKALAEAESKPDSTDVLGAKLPARGVLGVGPVLMIAVFGMMLGHSWTARRLETDATGAYWFGQFLGWPALITVVTMFVFPVSATIFAVATVVLKEAAEAGLDAAKTSHPLEVTEMVLVVVAAAALLWFNRVQALAWKRKLDATAVPRAPPHGRLLALRLAARARLARQGR